MTGDPYGDGWLDAHDERADWGWLHGITDPDRPAPFVHCAEHGPFPFSRTECPQCATEAGLSWARYRYIERVRRTT